MGQRLRTWCSYPAPCDSIGIWHARHRSWSRRRIWIMPPSVARTREPQRVDDRLRAHTRGGFSSVRILGVLLDGPDSGSGRSGARSERRSWKMSWTSMGSPGPSPLRPGSPHRRSVGTAHVFLPGPRTIVQRHLHQVDLGRLMAAVRSSLSARLAEMAAPVKSPCAGLIIAVGAARTVRRS